MSTEVKTLPVPESVYWKDAQYCRSCKAEIWWWKNPKTDAWVPVNSDSTSHFTTCPQAKKWSKKA